MAHTPPQHRPAVSPAVSVVIPARDASATILRALCSVLEQDAPPAEVIVVDDASRDDTAALVAAVPGVRLIRLATPQGAAAARNAGIAAARGEVVAFQDADDEWLPDKLRRQMALLQSDPSLLFVACGARLFGLDGQDRGPLYDGRVPRAGAEAWRGLLSRNTIATPCVLAWREALLAAGGFDARLPVAEDQDLWIRLSLAGRLGYLDACLVRVYVTRGSVSGVGTPLGARQQMQVTIPMIRRHLAALRSRLSRDERRRILGERLCRVGRAAYSHRLYRPGLAMVLEASLLGFRPLENLAFLAVASPPARWLKRRLGRA
jgi:glycosyltransferase involved in cell wall biosynthesis